MSEVFGPASMAMGQGVGAFTSFLPPISKVRAATPWNDPDVTEDVRMGELAACAVTLAVGAIVSVLSKSGIPFATALVTCIVLVVVYEMVLQREPRATTDNSKEK